MPRALARPVCAMGAVFLVLAMLAPGAAAQVAARISASDSNGFARVVLDFDEPLYHHKSLINGILIVTFDRKIKVDVSKLAERIPRYLIAARLDPDGESIRLALAQPATVKTITAGKKIFVDLLPETWNAPPPGLPEDVVADLIHQAERAAVDAVKADVEPEPQRPPLVVRTGRYPTFSRIVFDWSDPTPTVLSRRGNYVSIAFEREAAPDLSRLNADPPPQLMQAKAQTRKGGLDVELEVEEGTDVRGFREGTTYIVDLTGPKLAAAGEDNARFLGIDPRSAFPDKATGVEAVTLPGDMAESAAQPQSAPPEPTSDSLVSVSVTPLTLEPGQASEPAAPPQRQPASPDPAPDTAAPAPSEPAASPRPAQVIAESPSDQVATEPAAPADPGPAMADGGIFSGDDGLAAPAEPIVSKFDGRHTVSVSAKMVGSTLQLGFPFPRQVAAATFQRGNTLWVVFDTDAILEVSAIRKAAGDVIRELKITRSGTMQVLRLVLSGSFLTTATTRTHQWIITIGDLMLDPTTPLVVERALRSDGRSKVVIDLPQSGRVHWLADGEFADHIAVVTAFGPPRGLIKRQEFVEFTALATAHGIAIKPQADDLAVRLVQGQVVVTRDSGLTISAGRWPVFVPGRETTVDGSRPGFVDFEGWSQGGRARFRANVQRLLSAIAESAVEERVSPRLELARLYLANELAAEAIGIMAIAEDEDPEVINDPVYRAMRGVTNYMLGRTEEARADLAVHGLTQDPHSALWRGMVKFTDGHFREALLEFNDGRPALDSYSIEDQARFRLASARSALEINDLEAASRDLDVIINADLDRRDAGELLLLRSWLAQLLGATDAAVRGYAQGMSHRDRRVSIESEFRAVELALREGRMTPFEAIDTLERLAVSWRGDRLELAILRRLSHLYRDRGDYRDALETMKTAVINHEDAERARFIAEDMTSLFDHIFLGGGADEMSPIEALSLYYDFRELTPVGRRGDDMIRKLAHRLVEVDLLDQAAELLNHQVNNRLVGVAKAQVAADLALIYLTARQADNALRALRQSRQAVLPAELDRKRGLLEARALAELGRVEVAVDLLNTMTGDDIERAKADALWRGERWQRAGEQIERMLGSRWRDAEPLSDAERFDVMRVAISYVFAGDKLGMDRLRRKFASKMAESPDASAFNLVTYNVDPSNVAFRNLASEIAQVDTLDTFLEDFKARYSQVSADDADS